MKVFKELGLDDTQGGRHRACRSTIPSSIRSGRRAARAERAGLDSHRRAGAVLHEPPDYHERAVARAGALPEPRVSATDRFPSLRDSSIGRARPACSRGNPKTRFIAAHFGWHGNDLGRAAQDARQAAERRISKWGPCSYEFGRQPRAAREFFMKYQDRVLFGKDAYDADGVSVLLARLRDDATSTSTTTATITRSGSCTAWACRTRC